MHCIIILGRMKEVRTWVYTKSALFCKKAAAAAESPKKVSQILQASIRCVQFEVGCIQQVHH